MTSVFEFQAMTSGKADDVQAVFDKLNGMIETFYDECDARGVSVLQAHGGARPMTREEAVTFVPKKWHLNVGGTHACDTVHVSKRFLTEDREKVTCKLCLSTMSRKKK